MTQPYKTISGMTFFPVPEFTDADLETGCPDGAVFPDADMPAVQPEHDIAATLLHQNGFALPITIQLDVDPALATLALKAWLGKYSPGRLRTAAYAIWVWSTPAGERL